MFRGNNEIKKLLYKQKPTANLIGYGMGNEAYVKGFSAKPDYVAKEGDAFYYTYVDTGDDTLRVFFQVPDNELFNEEGDKIFNTEEPAQLLIRYIV